MKTFIASEGKTFREKATKKIVGSIIIPTKSVENSFYDIYEETNKPTAEQLKQQREAALAARKAEIEAQKEKIYGNKSKEA